MENIFLKFGNMSRLVKKPIIFGKQVTVSQSAGRLNIKGPKGERELLILPFVKIEIGPESLMVSLEKETRQGRANVGTMWSLTRSAIIGLTEGFLRVLEIEGIGFRAALEGKVLVLNLGFSNPIRFEAPAGVDVVVDKNTIKISGTDKQQVGQVAAKIRSFKKPEPYKGKGIHYLGEVIRRKAGKKASTTS